MNWIVARVEFEHTDPDLAVELISNIFYEMGLNGVMVEDPTIESTEAWAEGPDTRPDRYAVVGYIPADEQVHRRCRGLASALSRLSDQTGIRYDIRYDETAEEDWAESWKQFFKPEKVTDRLVVKPTWTPYRPGAGEIILEIDPGMAFGTGTHPTTALCLALIDSYLTPGGSFLDIGTGSGILMVAAAKLGAAALTGVDTDPMAVAVARENLLRNGIPEDRFSVGTGHLTRGIDTRYEIVVSNILSAVILDLLDDLASVLAPEGVFIFSGITRQNLQAVLDKMAGRGFRAVQVETCEEWVAVAGARRPYSMSNSFQSNQ